MAVSQQPLTTEVVAGSEALDFFKSVPELQVPVYFFAGRYDQNNPPQLTEQHFEQLITPAGKRLVWFQNSAHDILFDEPERLTEQVLAVLESGSKPQTP